jgi:catechol-2,3-dioxygenase
VSTAVNHVAISVTDIKQAMEWYRDVIGMSVLAEPAELSTDPSRTPPHLAAILTSIFGPDLGRFIICHMKSSNGVGIELFQFLDPPSERRSKNFEYWKTGFFHLAITDPHLERLAERIAASGGKKRTEVLELVSGSGKRICFCEDPFGNVIEIYSDSYERFWSEDPK